MFPMRPRSNLSNLPRNLLILIAAWPLTANAQQQWPYNIPPHMKYFPEDEAHVKRELSIQQRMAEEQPVIVRKMSADEGEKFYLEYWQFAADSDYFTGDHPRAPTNWGKRSLHEGDEQPANLSISVDPRAPLRLHGSVNEGQAFLSFAIRNILGKRDFQCPTGTQACTSINRPNSCCSTSDSCISIENTGLGDVGCCPQGQTCTGSVSSCDTAAGYSSCRGSSNGGCCIPNFTCQGIGCVYESTQTVIATLSPTVVVPPPSSSTPPSSTPPSSPPSSTSSSSSSGSSACSSGYQSCPASLGGGCCPTDRSCASGIVCAATGTVTATPPMRPTNSQVSVQATTSSAPASSVAVCPVGFYMCSAYYKGCCRVGRDCDSTSCPTSASTAVVESNGVTVVAPAGASLNTGVSLACATGWYSCAASVGGDCCPSGYVCGMAACTATASEGGTINKEAPASEAAHGAMVVGWVMIILATMVGIAMVVL